MRDSKFNMAASFFIFFLLQILQPNTLSDVQRERTLLACHFLFTHRDGPHATGSIPHVYPESLTRPRAHPLLERQSRTRVDSILPSSPAKSLLWSKPCHRHVLEDWAKGTSPSILSLHTIKPNRYINSHGEVNERFLLSAKKKINEKSNNDRKTAYNKELT